MRSEDPGRTHGTESGPRPRRVRQARRHGPRLPLLAALAMGVLLVGGVARGSPAEFDAGWVKEAGVRVEMDGTLGFTAAVCPSVVRLESGSYRIYFVSKDDSGKQIILSAVSTDGLTWQAESGVRLSAGSVYDSVAVSSPEVVRMSDGSWRMYYTGAGYQGSSYWWTILSARSTDGLHFTKDAGVRIGRGGPYSSAHASFPEVVTLPNGTYRMYYTGSNLLGTLAGSILSATSTDGLSWTVESGARLPEVSSWSWLHIGPDVFRMADGTYRMYYTSLTRSPYVTRLRGAVSTDGLSWTELPNDVLAPGGPYDSVRVQYTDVVQVAPDSYRMYYSGGDDTHWRILSAVNTGAAALEVSPDVVHFGQVEELWDEATAVVTITNVSDSDQTVTGISLGEDGDDEFAITSAPSTPHVLSPGSTVDVAVTFAPLSTGDFSSVLRILTNDDFRPVPGILLQGTGVISELPPDEKAEATLDFADEAVESGELEGDGPASSADGRLGALLDQIEAAGDLIAAGDVERAYEVLRNALRRVDGDPKPPDFVTGPAAADLALMIQNMIDTLE